MTFCCPVHGYYSPTPGTSVAICPQCSSPIGPPQSYAQWSNAQRAEYENEQLVQQVIRLRTALREIVEHVEGVVKDPDEMLSTGRILAAAKEALAL